MIMKKLIAIAVVFALAAGGVFAADLGATVFGAVRLMQADSAEGTQVNYDAGMTRIRLEGSGENDDGNFGAWIRFDPTGGTSIADLVSGLAWWKPIDQFKLSIGGNPDGLYGKEGYSGWMFYQMPSDIDIVDPASVWGGGYLNPGYWKYKNMLGVDAKYRNAFYGGFGGNGLMLDIKPVDMFGINIILPYFDYFGNVKDAYQLTDDDGLVFDDDGEPVMVQPKYLGGVFKHMTIQVDVNLDFGNIALTYVLDTWMKGADEKIGGTFFLYFGLTSIENLDLSLGIGFPLPKDTRHDPIAIGLAAKFDVNDAFGLKARLLAQLAGKTGDFKDPFVLGLDLLPYYAINDSLKAFVGLGLVMISPDGGDSVIGFHFNPYLQVGAEWGPTFYAGVRVWTDGKNMDGVADKSVLKFAIPIGLQVSF
jgi:opacity protein-like surface antigen